MMSLDTLNHYSKKNIKTVLNKTDLVLSNIKGLPFDAYYVSYLSSRLQKRFILISMLIGFISNLKAKYRN